MKLADVALLATVGATRIYTTQKTGALRVIVRSAQVDNRGRLFISVVLEDDQNYDFNVSAFSLSIPTEGA